MLTTNSMLISWNFELVSRLSKLRTDIPDSIQARNISDDDLEIVTWNSIQASELTNNFVGPYRVYV